MTFEVIFTKGNVHANKKKCLFVSGRSICECGHATDNIGLGAKWRGLFCLETTFWVIMAMMLILTRGNNVLSAHK